jgi:hypothetical protein
VLSLLGVDAPEINIYNKDRYRCRWQSGIQRSLINGSVGSSAGHSKGEAGSTSPVF